MKPVVLVLLLSFSAFFCAAQKAMPHIINEAGFDLKGAGGVVTVSIGEPAISTLITSEFIITQGFLQPEIIPCKDNLLTFYPNPTHDELTVRSDGCEVQIQSMQLFDAWGRLITSIKPESTHKVMLGDISPGVYFIKVFLSNYSSQTIKIAKVSN